MQLRFCYCCSRFSFVQFEFEVEVEFEGPNFGLDFGLHFGLHFGSHFQPAARHSASCELRAESHRDRGSQLVSPLSPLLLPDD